MARTGRKPQSVVAVQQLDGSERAKERLTMILKTIRQDLTVPEACAALGIGESRFHALRNQWLQQALELLEPRRMGRPPKSHDDLDEPQQAKLHDQVEQLQQQLLASEVRREIGAVMPHLVKQPANRKRGNGGPSQHRRPR